MITITLKYKRDTKGKSEGAAMAEGLLEFIVDGIDNAKTSAASI